MLQHAEKCCYHYQIQPEPTNESCSVELKYNVLECQVSSDILRSTFYVEWYYNCSSSADTTSSSSSSGNVSVMRLMATTAIRLNRNVTSQLNSSEIENGYYGCIINSNNYTEISTLNFGIVLYLSHQDECSIKSKQICNIKEETRSKPLSSTDHCADHKVELYITEARHCSHTLEVTTTTVDDVKIVIRSSAMATTPQHMSQETTNTVESTALSLSRKSWLVIGIFLGSLILIFLVTVGILMLCRNIKLCSCKPGANELPFDNICIHSSTVAVEERKCKMLLDATKKSSNVYCETVANVTYECPQAILSQQNNHIYDYIKE